MIECTNPEKEHFYNVPFSLETLKIKNFKNTIDNKSLNVLL